MRQQHRKISIKTGILITAAFISCSFGFLKQFKTAASSWNQIWPRQDNTGHEFSYLRGMLDECCAGETVISYLIYPQNPEQTDKQSEIHKKIQYALAPRIIHNGPQKSGVYLIQRDISSTVIDVQRQLPDAQPV